MKSPVITIRYRLLVARRKPHYIRTSRLRLLHSKVYSIQDIHASQTSVKWDRKIRWAERVTDFQAEKG